MGVPRLRFRISLATVGAAVIGCQKYEAKPFHPARFDAAWRERGTDEATVVALSKTLASTVPTTQPFNLRDGITLDEAQALALVYNPSLRIARQRAGVAQARAEHAGRWEDPTLGVDAERIISGVDRPWVVGGTLSLTLPISGRLEAERARAGAERSVELLRVAGQEWALQQRLREQWAEWSAQATRVDLLDALIGRLDEINRIGERLADAGAIPRASARIFRLERSSRQAERIAAIARLAECRVALHSTIGLTPDADVRLLPTLSIPTTPADRATLTQRNFEIRVATASYEVAEQTLRREVRAQYPDLVIGPGFGTDEGDERVLLGLSLPIPLWNRNQQGVAEATAGRELARAELETAIELQTAAVATAAVQRDAAIAQRDVYQQTIAPLADEQAAESIRLSELGEVDSVLLLDAFVRQYQAKLGALDAQLAVVRAETRLAELIGAPADAETPTSKKEGER